MLPVVSRFHSENWDLGKPIFYFSTDTIWKLTLGSYWQANFHLLDPNGMDLVKPDFMKKFATIRLSDLLFR